MAKAGLTGELPIVTVGKSDVVPVTPSSLRRERLKLQAKLNEARAAQDKEQMAKLRGQLRKLSQLISTEETR